MRYLLGIFLSTALVAAAGCNDNKGPASAAASTLDSTSVQWLDPSKDFGKIEEGQKLQISFRFRNSGNKPLVIDHVQPSCGCTVADRSTDPVAPGAEGQVRAVFNSDGHLGVNRKTLYVYSNTKGIPSMALEFVVEVEKKK